MEKPKEDVVKVVEVKALGWATIVACMVVLVVTWVVYLLSRHAGVDEPASNAAAVFPSLIAGIAVFALLTWFSIRRVKNPQFLSKDSEEV